MLGTHITVSIPTFNRTSLLFEALDYPLTDERISEIIVYDDHSNQSIFNEVYEFCIKHEKIKLFRGDTNLDCYKAKRESISYASNEYTIILDSDNRISKDYLDVIYAQHWSPERILQPSFAKPHFDFRKFNGLLANRKNVAKYAHDSTFTTLLNAMNFFIHRERYLEVWDGSVDPVTSDSIYFNYKWLEAGNSIYVVPGLEYEHLVHEQSHYKNNAHRTPHNFHNKTLVQLGRLR